MPFSITTYKSRSLLAGFVLSVLPLSLAFSKSLVFQESSQSHPTVATSAPVQQAQASSTSAPAINSELFFMLEQLQQEVRNLRGMIEDQAFQIEQLQRDGKNRYIDLDSRVLSLTKQLAAKDSSGSSSQANANAAGSDLSSTNAALAASSSVAAPSSGIVPADHGGSSQSSEKVAMPEPSDEQKRAYQEAYAFIKEKQFNEAVDHLHRFIEKYPEGELTGNAYYWLGEVYLVLPKLEQARQAFTIVISSFPGHRKEADAMFKLGVTLDRMQLPAESEKYLKEVQQKFPDSTAAKLAKSYKISQ